MKNKSGIHINPKNKGKFTARAKAHGNSVQEQATKDLAPNSKASATAKREANFAKNAAKWKK